MSTINFLIHRREEREKIAAIRRTVVAVTTAVLVAYVVFACGLLGWWWYWVGKDQKTSAEVSQLLSQTGKLSENEVMIRKLAERSTAVKGFLTNRGRVSERAKYLIQPGVQIVRWNYTGTEKEEVEISVENPADIDLFVRKASEGRKGSYMDKIIWDKEKGWSAVIVLADGAK